MTSNWHTAPMRSLLLVRHGESRWNVEGRWQGWIDIELTDHGVAQARARARALEATGHSFAAVASSDLVRAHRTAEILADHLGIGEHFVEPGLRERFGGDWQGLTTAEIHERFPVERDLWLRGELPTPPGGESLEAMLERFDAALTALDAIAPPGPLLVVSHGGVSRAVATRAGAQVEGVSGNLGGRWFELGPSGLVAGAELDELEAHHFDAGE